MDRYTKIQPIFTPVFENDLKKKSTDQENRKKNHMGDKHGMISIIQSTCWTIQKGDFGAFHNFLGLLFPFSQLASNSNQAYVYKKQFKLKRLNRSNMKYTVCTVFIWIIAVCLFHAYYSVPTSSQSWLYNMYFRRNEIAAAEGWNASEWH